MKKRIGQVLAMLGGTAVALAAMFLVDKVILGAREADAKVNAYEEAHNRHPEEISMKYDWYSGSGYISDNYNYNPEKDIIFDKEYNELWKNFFDEKMEVIEASMHTNVLIEDYNLITYFNGTEINERYDDLFIYGIYNTQPVAEVERVEAGAEIIIDIISQMGYNYNVCGVHIDYYDPSGVYRFSIDMDKGKITKEMLMECATEISFVENLAIQEKWEAFFGQRTTFWSFDVEGYEISLVGMEEYGDYQLMLKNKDDEKVLETYSRYETDNPREEYVYGTFDNILGYSGFYLFEMNTFAYGGFYVLEDNKLVCLADEGGTSIENCYVVDINNDGITELICNVWYGTGGNDAIIYYNDGTQILVGNWVDLFDVEYDNMHHTSLNSLYIPEGNLVEIEYYLKSSDGYEYKEYQVDDLDKITFYPYAKLPKQEIKKGLVKDDSGISKDTDSLISLGYEDYNDIHTDLSFVNFGVNFADEVKSGTIYVEQWNNGECIKSFPGVLAKDINEIYIRMNIDPNGVEYNGNVAVWTDQYGGEWWTKFAFPEEEEMVAWYFESYEQGCELEVQPGEERILAAMAFDNGSGVSEFDCDTLVSQPQLLEEAGYMIVVRAIFDNEPYESKVDEEENAYLSNVFWLDEVITVEDEDRKAAYISALEKILYQRTSIEGDDWVYGLNKLAVLDIDSDGKEELLIEHNGSMADSKLYIYDYDEKTETVWSEFFAYPALTFYDNGIDSCG